MARRRPALPRPLHAPAPARAPRRCGSRPARPAARAASATTRPPLTPPSGPRSMTQSASAITSRSCSITTTLWPPSTSRCSTRISRSTSAMCRPDRRLVEHVERVRRLVAALRDVVAHLAQLGDELDALRLAARQRRRRLAERQVAEADVLQQLQRVRDVRHRGEEVDRLVDLHLQHVADALAAPAHRQRLGVEALRRGRRRTAPSRRAGSSSRSCARPALRSPGSGPRRC